MRRRSNLLVLLGLASFVLGVVAVYFFTKDDARDAGGDTVEILVATDDLDAGTPGNDILTEERYTIVRVPASTVSADHVTAPSQLSNTVLTLNFVAEEPLRLSGLRSLGTVTQAVIPEGLEAVTITTPFVNGGAATIAPGNRINLYLVIGEGVSGGTSVDEEGNTQAAGLPYPAPRAELLLANVEVLDVQPGTPPLQVGGNADPATGTQTTVTGGTLIFVLALDTLDAEKVILASTSADLYVSRVRLDDEGNPPEVIESTPGQDFLTILTEEASVANDRTTSTTTP